MTRLSIRDRIREIQDDDIDQVLQRYPIRVPTYPHTRTYGSFMEDAEDAARLKVDQAGEIDDLKTKHEREVDALKVRHERESNRQKSDDESEKEREANQAKRQSESVEESYSRSLVNKAIKLIKSPKYFQGDYTGAVKAIEKLKKGLSSDGRVKAALQTANEHHKKNGMHTHSEGVAVIDKKTGKTLAYYDSPKMAKNFEPNQKYVRMTDKEFTAKYTSRKGGFFGRTGRIPNAKKNIGKGLWNEVLGKDASQKDYIDDFLKSDSPQFKGKTKDKIIQMAVAAYKGK